MPTQPFSEDLERWMKSPGPKTLAQLNDVFGEKTFAIALLLLLAPSALPIPTGGITNIFEIIAMLLALEMTAGLRTVWLPQKLRHRKLGEVTTKKAMPFIIKRVRWFEKYSRPRMSRFTQNRQALRLAGLLFFLFTLGAFVAPPFSGLDTLPSLGVVILALAIILEDAFFWVLGVIAGVIGIIIEISFWAVITRAISGFFS